MMLSLLPLPCVITHDLIIAGFPLSSFFLVQLLLVKLQASLRKQFAAVAVPLAY